MFSIFIHYCFLLQDIRDNLVNYIHLAKYYDELEANESDKQQFVVVDCFFERLANQLFFEKHDSELVKELFLASPYTDLIGCLYLGYFGEYFGIRRHYTFETVFAIELNLYRLGFETFSCIRLVLWIFRDLLNIKSERDYKIALQKAIVDYCIKYKCDEHDKKLFDELLNYQFSATALKLTKRE